VTLLQKYFPKQFGGGMTQILPMTVSLLTQNLDFANETLASQMIYSLFDFYTQCLASSTLRNYLSSPPLLSTLFHSAILLVQATEEQVEDWKEDLNQFLQENDPDSTHSSVRNSALQFLEEFIEGLSESAVPILASTLKDRFSIALNLKKEGGNWHVLMEACLLVFARHSEILLSKPDYFTTQFFFTNIIQFDALPCPLLYARMLSVAALLTTHQPEYATFVFQVVLQNIQNVQSGLVCIMAYQSLPRFIFV
jgi:hypothetical protein